ncbi:MAG: PilZ domain-containing protein [Fimbriimonadaceae bacterium]|nr:PilZ domain-containing protein [Fimbriimonadaceae bacterium]QYK55926.1 MAG: PilZ domain-containing protein [Fimbriimonadaceae bacterium]
MGKGNPYEGNRARLQRLSDAKFFGGWVLRIADKAIVVKAPDAPGFQTGETFHFQVFGQDASLVFQARFASAIGDQAVFELSQNPRQIPSNEQARRTVRGITANLAHPSGSVELEIFDASYDGLGVLCALELQNGETYQVQMQSPVGDLQVSATVRHCKPAGDRLNRYRVGFQIQADSRTELARWRSQLGLAA